jgi:hypothetical protein
MKKLLLQLLFCILAQSAFGQSNRFHAIVKTHPVAYIAKNFNLGFEIGRGLRGLRHSYKGFIIKLVVISTYPKKAFLNAGNVRCLVACS